MKLIKSCRSEFNPLKGADIQVGSYEYYRSVENDEIRDAGEASVGVEIEWLGRHEISADLYNELMQGGVHIGGGDVKSRIPGNFSMRIHNLNIVKSIGDKVVIENFSATIHRCHMNNYIYCMSLVEDDSMGGIFDGYDDFWSLPMDKANDFALFLASELREQLNISDFSYDAMKDLSFSQIERGGLHVHVQHQAVQYLDRKVSLNSSNEKEVVDALSRIGNMVFTKPSEFSSDREYRFQFSFYLNFPDGRRLFVSPEKDRFLIRLNRLKMIGAK